MHKHKYNIPTTPAFEAEYAVTPILDLVAIKLETLMMQPVAVSLGF
jgi:hypothetical protein